MTGGEDNNARFATIESNVGALKSEVTTIKGEVTSINDKLDKLIDNFGKLTSHASSDTHSGGAVGGHVGDSELHGPPVHESSVAHPVEKRPDIETPRHSHIPSHRCAGMQVGLDKFIQTEKQRDRFDYVHNGNIGHISDFQGAHSIPKPYMYVVREGINTQKQKLDIRHQITALEYVDASLALLADKRAYNSKDLDNIMCHLKNVTRDALERPWPAVRRWSQYIWDCVEEGHIRWADRDSIQQERVRICLTGGGVMLNHTTANAQRRGQNGAQEVVCRAYNTRQGCSYRDSHQDGAVFAMHICSYCDHIGRACAHSIKECERKITHARGYQDNNGQGNYSQGAYQGYNQGYNRFNNNQGQGNNRFGSQNQANYSNQYSSKNGGMAPHQ